jgi:hypothetical protein
VFSPRLNLSRVLFSLAFLTFLDQRAYRRNTVQAPEESAGLSESVLATIHPTCHLQDRGFSSDGVERGGQQGFPVRMRIFKGGVGLQKLWIPTKFNLALPVVCPEGPCGWCSSFRPQQMSVCACVGLWGRSDPTCKLDLIK